MSKKRLGKGLSALINNDGKIDQSRIEEVFIDQIEANPFQPRSNFDEESLTKLANSIKEKGIIQPITLRKIKAERYQIVAGERRWRSAKIAGLTKVPAVIRNFNEEEMLEIALIENIQREDLNPVEEAVAYQEMLVNFEITQEELAKRVGKSRSNIANMIRLLKLADKVRKHLEKERISIGHARALLALEKKSDQIEAAEDIIINDLTVRETEEYVTKLKNPLAANKKKTEVKSLGADWENALSKLEKKLETKVEIKQRKKNNLLTIEIDSLDKLNQLINKL